MMLRRMDLFSSDLPSALKSMSTGELVKVSEEVRSRILDVVLKNGGHLGASLGAVELTVALHAVFDSPHEPIIFDVGHQSYAHKLLTGRWETFDTLRKYNGISGFTSRQESEHDPFGAGHASTALSAAVGMRAAMNLKGDTDHWVVAVVGDGALTGGMAFEALNGVRRVSGRLLVLFNRNGMSISPTAGSVGRSWTSEDFASFFRLFGLTYMGPTDGHDIGALLASLKKAKSLDGPVVLEVHTIKGMGYEPAMRHHEAMHGVEPPNAVNRKPTFTSVFGETLVELAGRDPRIVAITAAMESGTGLSDFARRFPDRFFDVGIGEQHAVTMAAGMAARGLRPVVAIYSTFLQRAYDQIIHDVALQSLPVVFAVDRAGMVGADGPTHHGMFDVPALLAVPSVTIAAPADRTDLKAMLEHALTSEGGPHFIRYPRAYAPDSDLPIVQGTKARKILVGDGRCAVVTSGAILEKAFNIIQLQLKSRPTVWDVRYLKPMDPLMLEDLARHRNVMVVEESPQPSLAAMIALQLDAMGSDAQVRSIGTGDSFVPHGPRDTLLERHIAWQDLTCQD